MAWIEVHQSLFTHHKTAKLTRIMGETNTASIAGHLISFWCWAIDNAPDGELTSFDSLLISVSSGFKTRKQGLKWISALVDAGFVDKDADGRLFIHDWDIYIGKLIDSRENKKAGDRARAQKYRDKKKGASRVTECDGHAPTVPYRNPTLQNPTQPDTTSLPNPSHAGLGERATGERINPPGTVDDAIIYPTVSEVRAYAALSGMNVDAEAFVRSNEANGWRDSRGDPIRDWKLWLQGTLIRRTQGDTAQSKAAAFEALYHQFKEEEQGDQS